MCALLETWLTATPGTAPDAVETTRARCESRPQVLPLTPYFNGIPPRSLAIRTNRYVLRRLAALDQHRYHLLEVEFADKFVELPG